MKIIEKNILNSKIEELINKNIIIKNSKVYDLILNISTDIKFRPVYYNSKHNYSTVDISAELKYILDNLGLDYEIGNDAPKGGKTGYFIKIITKII